MKIFIYICIILGTIAMSSCTKDFLDHESKDFVSQKQFDDFVGSSAKNLLQVLESSEAAQYAKLGDSEFLGANGMLLDAMTESVSHKGSLNSIKRAYTYNMRLESNSANELFWTSFYKIIFDCNKSLLLIGDSEDPLLVDYRAKFRALRAFSYFQLIQTYQHNYQFDASKPGIPLYDGDDISVRNRGTVQSIYDFILEDMEYAYHNIGEEDRPDKGWINKAVIAGIYARILLETGTDYQRVVSLSQEARANYSLMSGEEWQEGWGDWDNPEWIWGQGRANNESANTVNLYSVGFPLSLTRILRRPEVDKRFYESIPDSDFRKTSFDDDLYVHKFRLMDDNIRVHLIGYTTDVCYMRAGEMYLIEAEALARSGNTQEASDVLFELVSTRDSTYQLPAGSQAEILDEIYHQRNIELWGEGQSLFAMKRFGKGLNRDYEDSNHEVRESRTKAIDLPPHSNKFVFQIPFAELEENPEINAEDQNPLED